MSDPRRHSTAAYRRNLDAAFELVHGPVGPGLVVRHTCDNPPCVNPDHLIVGTQADNLADAKTRGRTFHPAGSRHPGAKLTEADIPAIRALYGGGAHPNVIAARLGVSPPTIYNILAGRIWRHVA